MPHTAEPTPPRWWKSFIPPTLIASRRERALACLCAGAGMLLAGWLSQRLLGGINPWFIAPMGASAVLLFALPASPLAQPWSVVGGNLVSALVGVSCAHLISDPVLATALAVALAIGAMFALRCLHPPGGAVAATAVLGGPAVTALGYGFALTPVLANSVGMVACALLFNNLLRHHRYPHVAHAAHAPAKGHQTADPLPSERFGFNRADLDAVIQDYEELLDISEDDLEAILHQVELRAFARRIGPTRCADIMSRDVITVDVGMSVEHAWHLLGQHNLRALPVTDGARGLAGIVTLRDLLDNGGEGLPRQRRRALVGEAMTRHVQVARPEQPIGELVSLLSDQGLHHLPVIDEKRHIVGMLSQSDVIAALFRIALNSSPHANAA
jgi:CBS domain-containing membrane protein